MLISPARALQVLTALTPAEATDWWLAAWRAGAVPDLADLTPVLEDLRPRPGAPLTWGGERVIVDGELVLRPMQPADVPALVAAADSAVGRWTSVPYPLTVEAAGALVARSQRQWSTGEAARFTVVCNDVVVGSAGLLHVYPETADAEVGYWLSPAARGHGRGRRTTAMLCDWATQVLGCTRLHLEVDWDNAASHRTALSCGFEPVGPVEWVDPRSGARSICLKYVR